MASILNIGGSKFMTVDRMWRDNGKDPEYAMVGGSKVLLDKGSRAKPVIAQIGKRFVYQDGTPVTKREDVEWLPEPFRTTAIKFVEEATKASEPVEVPTYETKEEAMVAALPKKGRGRPKKAEEPKSKEIKDEASLQAAIEGRL